MTCGFLIQLDGYTISGELEKDVFRLVTSVGQRKNFELGKEIGEDVFSSRGLRIFPLSHARDKTKKKTSSISLTSSKLAISRISLCLIVCNAFLVVHIMLFLVISFFLRWSLSKFVYIMRQLHYSLVVQPS